MPVLRRMTDEEVATLQRNNTNGDGARKAIEKEYDAYVAEYSIGEHVVVELSDEEMKQRATIRNRLEAAAKRRGLTLNFIKTRGNAIRFKVEQTADESVLELFGPAKVKEAVEA